MPVPVLKPPLLPFPEPSVVVGWLGVVKVGLEDFAGIPANVRVVLGLVDIM